MSIAAKIEGMWCGFGGQIIDWNSPPLGGEKPSIFACTLIFATVQYKSRVIASYKHSSPLPSKNYIRIIAFTLKPQRAIFLRIIVFFHYNTIVSSYYL